MKNTCASIVLVLLAVLVPSLVRAEPPQQSIIRPDMDAVYRAYRELQKYIYNRAAFSDPSNEQRVGQLLQTLRARFHHVEEKEVSADPGFTITLTMVQEMLDDARNRFFEGNKSYALWRLRAAGQYCITCHTRRDVTVTFFDQDPGVSALPPIERAEFFLATRQFDRARALLLDAIRQERNPLKRDEALARWLIIDTRAEPNPTDAIKSLRALQGEACLTSSEREQIQGWIRSFQRWEAERIKTDGHPLETAQALIEQGIGQNRSTTKGGLVELLRATALLHDYLDRAPTGVQPPAAKRSEALYLLALAYQALTPLFVNELPENFLEQAMRESPGTPIAKKAYRLFEAVVTLGFTGSGGVQLPVDVSERLRELKAVAEGRPLSLPQG